jgi:carbonic anhydrase
VNSKSCSATTQSIASCDLARSLNLDRVPANRIFTMMRTTAKILTASVSTVTLFSAVIAAETLHWGYEGDAGPKSWGKLSPANAMCDLGKNQSPIDIRTPQHTSGNPLRPTYSAKAASIINNGHTVQIDFAPGSSLTVDNTVFELKQVHFHAPSENLIEGRSFAMEGHFVHADAKGNLLVVGLMFDAGDANSALARIWPELPAKPGAATRLATSVNAMEFLPAAMSYYRFSGSLTTPPCSEGVRWLVLKAPVSVSKTQVDAFHRAVHHDNNRPVQPLNGRVIIDN